MRHTLLLLTFLATGAPAQWQLHDAHTTADLRGIDNVGNGVAWASGTDGTILRTEDAGFVWQLCAKPPGGEHLDFRAIQAFDNTAIIMSSGKGDLSRLYKTTDGCQTWKLLFTNPDKDGFWDALQANSPDHFYVLGDAVEGKQRILEWEAGELGGFEGAQPSKPQESSFAASNSVLQIVGTPQEDKRWKSDLRWASGSPGHAYFHYQRHEQTPTCEPCVAEFALVDLKLRNSSSSAGIFSFAFRSDLIGVLVGGDYAKSKEPADPTAFTTDGGKTWTASTTPPHGYRSAVAYDSKSKTWITVGPNGTDISTDDGRTWRALHPNPAFNDTPDADQHWNALSLPFVVGPHGRIGKLNPKALAP
jgi:photosystem II stability/assembly factor-like uncharacterized protein